MEKQINIADKISDLAGEIACLASLALLLADTGRNNIPSEKLIQEGITAFSQALDRIARDLDAIWTRAYELEDNDKRSKAAKTA